MESKPELALSIDEIEEISTDDYKSKTVAGSLDSRSLGMFGGLLALCSMLEGMKRGPGIKLRPGIGGTFDECERGIELKESEKSHIWCGFCTSTNHDNKDHKCEICETKGHDYPECPDRCIICYEGKCYRHSSSLYHTPPDHRCYVCNIKGEESHLAKDCPDSCTYCPPYSLRRSKMMYHHTTQTHKCFICGKKGHPMDECPDRCRVSNELHTFSHKKCISCGKTRKRKNR